MEIFAKIFTVGMRLSVGFALADDAGSYSWAHLKPSTRCEESR